MSQTHGSKKKDSKYLAVKLHKIVPQVQCTTRARGWNKEAWTTGMTKNAPASETGRRLSRAAATGLYGTVDYHGRGSLSELSADKSWFCLIDEAIWLTDTNITQDTFVVDVQIRLEILSAGLSNRVYSCHQQRAVLLTGADVLQVGCDVREAAHRMRILRRYAPSGIQATVQRPPDDDHVILGAVYGQRFRRTEYI